jgi:hypothetical protein
MIAVYGNLMITAITVALFLATVNLRRTQAPRMRRPTEQDHPQPAV